MNHEALIKELNAQCHTVERITEHDLELYGYVHMSHEGGDFYCWLEMAGFMTYDTATGELDWIESMEKLMEQLDEE